MTKIMDMRRLKSCFKVLTILVVLVFLSTSGIFARALFDTSLVNPPVYKGAADEPYVTIGVHKIGKIALTVSNQGHFGRGFLGAVTDPLEGGEAPSCTYPYPGRQSYLFAGSFWIGAVVGRDTLVSVGADGWHDVKELWPDPYPRGQIIYRSISGVDAENAVSEQDYIAIYTDTVTNPQHVNNDPFDGRPHIPLGIEVTQRTYAWSYSYAEDFILFDYSIKNIGRDVLEQVYMGFYVDADVNYGSTGEGHDDDICGFKVDIPSDFGCGFRDTINIAYIADNDGRQSSSEPCPFNESSSLTAVTGMRVVRTPSDTLNYAFNWWLSNGSAALDFGPRKYGTPEDPFRDFGGFLGTPEGDKNKYYVMRHGEFDYDQLFSAVDHSSEGWLPPDEQADNFADGFDTRYLLSFGPFNIDPGEVLPVSFAYIAGEDFHTDCYAFENLFNAYDPEPYYDQLGFSDFGENSMWASWIYDNPGYDTDGNGYLGKFRICGFESTLVFETISEDPLIVDTSWQYTDADTNYYEGDGVPDFRGAAPPPAPEMWIVDTLGDTVGSKIYPSITEHNCGELRVRWNGLRSEMSKDIFSNEYDFEGFRIYLSETLEANDFVLIGSFDHENYNKYIWNYDRRIWQLTDPPYLIDSLQTLYEFPEGFDPTTYDIDHPFIWGDSTFYFSRQDWNQSDLSDTFGIHKVYPNEPFPTTLVIDSARIYYPEELTDDGLFYKYFEYEYVIRDLLPSKLYYVAVTAFDYGSPGHDLASLENPPNKNYIAEYAQNTNQVVADNKLEVIVYPNPYRIDGNYQERGFEGVDYIDSTFGGRYVKQQDLIDDRIRGIHFTNLPPKCTIRIFTLDGDLVREINHNFPPDSPRSMHERWDMISRNTQSVASGIYYWTVESANDTQMGKLVIIK